jgi:uncharacterized protein (TIGR00251 family)
MPPRPAQILRVRVKPRSAKDSLSQLDDGNWVARVKAPPVDGKANKELLALVARHFGTRKANVTIKSGTSGRIKIVPIRE